MKSIFDSFTKKYSLSKTLRFELIPTLNTAEMLKEEDVFNKDKIIKDKYEKTKPYFDKLHKEFIEESLFNKKISKLKDYFNVLSSFQKNKKDKNIQKELREISQKLRKEVNGFFKTEKLFREEVFNLLKEKYGKEEDSFLKNEKEEYILDENNNKISIFDSWKGFTGYFIKFQETRKNIYKDDGIAGAVATRIIDQNLKRFCDNILIFEKDLKNRINFKEAEDNFSIKIDNIFCLDNYNNYLIQNGIDKYNQILGEINQIINEYRQKTKEKLPFLKLLDRQILGEEKEDFIFEIKNDEELLDELNNFYNNAEEKINTFKKLFDDFIKNNQNYNLREVYLSKVALNSIFNKWIDANSLLEFKKDLFEALKKDKIEGVRYEKKDYKFCDFISFYYLKEALNQKREGRLWKDRYYLDETEKNNKGFLKDNEDLYIQFLRIFEFEFNSLFKDEIDNKKGYIYYKKLFEKIIKKEKDDFSVSKEDKIIIRNFADNTLSIYQMARYFSLEKKSKWIDEYNTGDFYNNPDFGYKLFYEDAYEKIVKKRMLLQSYLTKKPFNINKWKLNFENPTLAGGFDKNKETDNSAVILRKGGRYFLGIMKKGHNKTFDDKNKELFLKNIESGKYEKMVYKFFPDPKKMLPKVCFSKKGISFFNPSNDIIEIYEKGKFKKGDNFSISSMHRLIDFYKDSLKKYDGWKDYNFVNVKETKEYKNDIGEFFHDVETDGYKIYFEDISEEYIKEKNEKGELFLFKIHNKDWNLKDGKIKTGTKNIHTLYFESLFSEENIENNFLFKLNGNAELFFRPKTEEEKLGYKEDKNKNKVINHKRYFNDKIFFHTSICLNRVSENLSGRNFKSQINNFLCNNKDINIIGIDRGEKNLIYYAGIDQSGNILKGEDGKEVLGSLNEINNKNYYKLLEERSKKREKEKQDWQEIENIKDLKMGYISLVVRKLADLVIKHNAIIVFEDLSMRFKQIRGGIEKSVYQQLEKALIDKLNFLVDKKEENYQNAGSLFNAYQLTSQFENFKDMGKQTGIIFYTQASYTSKTCPLCGFRPNISFRFENIEKSKKLFEKVKIEFKENCFKINYRITDFIKENNKISKKKENILYEDKSRKNDFSISSKDAIRYKWHRRDLNTSELRKGEEKLKEETEKGTNVKYNITECLISLFKENNTDYLKDINKQIIENNLSSKFYKDLSFYLYLLTGTRSSISGKDMDYINCPCCGFHSNDGFNGFKFNGDANGAYNIARKGIMVLEKIKQYKEQKKELEKIGWGDLSIGIEEWDKFTQIISKKISRNGRVYSNFKDK